MKDYSYTKKMKIYVIEAVVFTNLPTLFLIFYVKNTSVDILLISYCWITLTFLFLVNTFISRLNIYEDRLEKYRDLRNLIINKTIYWNDISKINCYTKLSRFNMVLILHRKEGGEFNGVGIDIAHYPLELLSDILSRVPVSTIVELDPWLKEQYIKEFGDGIFKRFLFTQ